MGTQKPAWSQGPAAVPEKALDAGELATQVSDAVADAVMRKLSAIGLTAENIKKLERLGEIASIDALGGVSEAGSLTDAVSRKLPAIGPVERNVNTLATGGGGSQTAGTPVHLDDNLDTSEIPSSSFTEDPFDSSTWTTESNLQGSLSSLQMSGDLRHLAKKGPLLGQIRQFSTPPGPPIKLHSFDTLPQSYSSPLQFSTQQKRAISEELIPRLKKRARHNQVNCEKDEDLGEDRSECFRAGGDIRVDIPLR